MNTCNDKLKRKQIDLYIIGHDFLYEIENVCRLFLPEYKYNFLQYDKIEEENFNFIYTKLDNQHNGDIILQVRVNFKGNVQNKTSIIHKEFIPSKQKIETLFSAMLFRVLSNITGLVPSWGIVTGVRPVKLFRTLLAEGGKKYARNFFENEFLVSKKKIDLCEDVNKYENKILGFSISKSFSLYISIPFCPSRCSYCSFVSQSVEHTGRMIPQYMELLSKELAVTSEIVREAGLKLESVYIGGGTPGVLDGRQMEDLITTINKNFDIGLCREFTVEIGRPDTVTPEKLKVMKNLGVGRISINPQTFNDDVLKIIGRKHTSIKTIEAFKMARKFGFSDINMDLIVGLPGDSKQGYLNTLERTLDLNPEGITVHTLSIKRASNISVNNSICEYQEDKLASELLDFSSYILPKKGYHPYYLYRQSKMVGNLENVGWALEGHDGFYNIFTMDEIHSIIACGAGAVTKLRNFNSNDIERIFNFKFAYEYISRFDEIIQRKGKVKKFYEKL